jgi:hypothetical protein
VYLAYIDDSEFTAKKDQHKSVKSQAEQFQVLCAVLVPDVLFAMLEIHFTLYALTAFALPEGFPVDFEFHAHELFHGTGFFENWEQPKRFRIFEQCMNAVAQMHLPVLYGAVEKEKLSKQIYKSANPLDMSFRLCVEQIQKRLKATNPWQIGLLIADSFDDGKKRNLKQVFREYRKKFSVEALEVMERVHKTGAPGAQTPEQAMPSNLLDDMYFGDSRDSVGIQAADMCSFLIRRHLAGKQDSEWLFKIIESQTSGSIWPE